MHQPKNSRLLPFTIPYAQSSDPSYPASNLLDMSTNPSGWQSARFCTYPQEIILQFQSPVMINKAQLLSHEKKIATRVDVYIGRGRADLENVQFRKIGYLLFHSNAQSQYQARELKTVTLDEQGCNYLKLVILKNHDNKFNPFNQIGFMAIRCFGDRSDLPPPTANKKYLTEQQKVLDEIQNQDQLIDPKVLQILLTLEYQKEQAISHEDYAQAKILKARITELRSFGLQIKDLEEKKKNAIANEDFDLAMKLKEDIDQLRHECGTQQSHGPSHHIRSIHQNNHADAAGASRNQSVHSNAEEGNQDQTLMQLNEKIEQGEITQHEVNEFEIQAPPRHISHDDQVIPTLANKKNALDETVAQPIDVEELTGEALKAAEPFIPIFGMEFCQKYFSQKWQQKEEGIKWLIKQLANPTEIQIKSPDAMFQSGLFLSYKGMNDKVDKIIFSSLQLMQSLLNGLRPKAMGEDTPIMLDNMMLILMDKLGDINERNKEECKKIIMQLAESQIVSTQWVIGHLIKGITTKPNLQISSTRHIQARLMIIYTLIQKFKISNDRIPYNLVMETAIKYLDHQAEQVRTTAIYIITEAYRHQPEKVRESLRGIRPAQMQILEELFLKLDQGVMLFQESTPAPKKKKAAQQQQQQQSITLACEFCGIEDKEFVHSQKLDIHLWKDCVMLTTCPACAQVVEVSELSSHMLDECEFKTQFRQCQTCGSPIKDTQLQEHQNKQACNGTASETCPLCYQAIGLNWKVHLASCKQQERNRKPS